MPKEEKLLPAAIPIRDTLMLNPVMDAKTALAKLAEFEGFIKEYLKKDLDYGVIPGTGDKPTLLLPGAEKLCELYGFYPDYEIIQRIEDWDRSPELFDYDIKCVLRSKRDDSIVATGMGNCNSYESKYRWRNSARTCPECKKEGTLLKSKFPDKQTGKIGFYCFAKSGGCGANFGDPNDSRIVNQEVGKVANPDMASQKNTILQMAQKRSCVKAIRSATRSSQFFTQDIEDFSDFEGMSFANAEVKDVTEAPKQTNAGSEPAPKEPNASTAITTVTPTTTNPNPSLTQQIEEADEVSFEEEVSIEECKARIKEACLAAGYKGSAIGVVLKAHFQIINANMEEKLRQALGDILEWFKANPNPSPGEDVKFDLNGFPIKNGG